MRDIQDISSVPLSLPSETAITAYIESIKTVIRTTVTNYFNEVVKHVAEAGSVFPRPYAILHGAPLGAYSFNWLARIYTFSTPPAVPDNLIQNNLLSFGRPDTLPAPNFFSHLPSTQVVPSHTPSESSEATPLLEAPIEWDKQFWEDCVMLATLISNIDLYGLCPNCQPIWNSLLSNEITAFNRNVHLIRSRLPLDYRSTLLKFLGAFTALAGSIYGILYGSQYFRSFLNVPGFTNTDLDYAVQPSAFSGGTLGALLSLGAMRYTPTRRTLPILQTTAEPFRQYGANSTQPIGNRCVSCNKLKTVTL